MSQHGIRPKINLQIKIRHILLCMRYSYVYIYNIHTETGRARHSIIFSENALLISGLNIKHTPNISEIYCYAVMNYLVLNISHI